MAWEKNETQPKNVKEWAFTNESVKEDTCKCIDETSEALLTEKAYRQIKTLCAKYPELEWGAGLIGKQDDKGNWTIDEIKLFEQEVRGAFVELTDAGNAEMAKTKTIGWIHSHNTMEAFFSKTDIDNAMQVDGISIVVNDKSKFASKIRRKVACGSIILTDLELKLEIGYENEIAEASNILIKEKTGYITYSSPTMDYGNSYDEVCRWCYEKVGKKKYYVDGGIVHKRCKKEFDEWYKTSEKDKSILEEEIDENTPCEACGLTFGNCQCYDEESPQARHFGGYDYE